MKYIVWELISPYDGYGEAICNSWDDVLSTVEEAINAKNHPKGKQMFNLWKKGKIDRIAVDGILIFVTTVAINAPVKDN